MLAFADFCCCSEEVPFIFWVLYQYLSAELRATRTERREATKTQQVVVPLWHSSKKLVAHQWLQTLTMSRPSMEDRRSRTTASISAAAVSRVFLVRIASPES